MCIRDRAANLDRSNAEIVVFTAGDEVAHDDVRRALADADEHKADDQATRDLIQKMLDCYALIGATNDYYSAAKKKMWHSAKSAYKPVSYTHLVIVRANDGV